MKWFHRFKERLKEQSDKEGYSAEKYRGVTFHRVPGDKRESLVYPDVEEKIFKPWDLYPGKILLRTFKNYKQHIQQAVLHDMDIEKHLKDQRDILIANVEGEDYQGSINHHIGILDFLLQQGVILDCPGEYKYLHLPFWFEQKRGKLYMINGELPGPVKEYLKTNQSWYLSEVEKELNKEPDMSGSYIRNHEEFMEKYHNLEQEFMFNASQVSHTPRNPKKPIDYVTTDLLDIALRLSGINAPIDVVDKLIDLVEMLEDTKGEAGLQELVKLHKEWGFERGEVTVDEKRPKEVEEGWVITSDNGNRVMVFTFKRLRKDAIGKWMEIWEKSTWKEEQAKGISVQKATRTTELK